MTLLAERWPKLASIPHVALGHFPTAIEHAAALSQVVGADVWIKRDDRAGALYGGNKVRKLEFLLAQAKAEGADTILTTGAIGSHHVLATSLYGRAHGFEVHAVMMPQPETPHVRQNVRADLAAGAVLHPISSYALFPTAMTAIAARLKLQGKKLFVIGPGGSDASGVLGWIEGGLEIGRQLALGTADEFDVVYVPLGSGGTAAGIALGLAAMGVMAQVVAVRVTPRHLMRKGMLATLSRGLVQRLRSLDDRFPAVAPIAMQNLTIEERFLGEGYGMPTGSGREATRILLETERLELDASYTAKTMAALIQHAREHRRGQRLLFVHTLSSVPITKLAESAPALPRRLAALMR